VKKSETVVTQSKPTAQPSTSKSYQQFQCCECEDFMIDQEKKNQNLWVTCYDCDNWYCGSCKTPILFTRRSYENDEFCSNDCYSNS
jgi:hypothetical protein